MATTAVHVYDRAVPIYAPGEEIRLTVRVTVDDPPPTTGTVRTETVVTMPDGVVSEPVVTESTFTVDPAPGTARSTVVSDSSGRAWTRAEQAGNDTTFRTVA